MAELVLKIRPALLFACQLLLLLTVPARPADWPAPRPPCAGAPIPDFPNTGDPPNVKVWNASDLPPNWTPPSCTPWPPGGATIVSALSGQFPFAGGMDALKARIGAISSMGTVRYWSVMDKEWMNMFVHAVALDGPDAKKTRADFSPAELSAGATLYFIAADNRSGRDAVSRLHVIASDDAHFALETENVTPLRYAFFTYAAPGAFQTWYFLQQGPANSWRFYSVTRVKYASSLFGAIVPERSYVNRAVAMYRHFLGQKTDQDPPAAP